MKKYNLISIFFLFVMLGFGTGCTDDFLTEDVKGKLTNEGFPKNVDQLEEAVHGLYNSAAALSGQAAIITRNCGTEQLTSLLPPKNKYYQAYCDNYTIHLEQATAGEPRDMPIWAGCYGVVKQANWLLESVDNAQVADPVILDLARGQAHFFRAFAYFNLTRYFGEIPLVTDTDINKKITSLATVKDVYDLILSDLQSALDMLPEFAWNTANIGSAAVYMPKLWMDNKALPTQGTVKSLRSMVYITMAGWPLNETQRYADAAVDAKWVIDHKDNLGYGLEPDYKNLWLYEKQFELKEDIISFHYHGDGRDQWFTPQATRPESEPGEPWNGWNDVMVERPYYFSFPESYRKNISFTTAWYTKRTNTPDSWKKWYEVGYFHPYLAKFRSTVVFPYDSLWVDNPKGNAILAERSIIMLRYANVLTNYAEASTRATNTVSTEALEAINQIRRRAHNNPKNTRYPINNVDIYSPNAEYDLPAGLSSEQFLDSVLQEKNWEFAGEPEGRWHDLVRLDKVYETAQMVKAQRANTQSTNKTGDQSLPTSTYLHPLVPNLKEVDIITDRKLLHWYFPPLSEMKNNPDLFK